MSNHLIAKVGIEGTRSIYWHRFGPDAIPLQKVETTGVPGNDPEEWRRTVLMTKTRQLYLEPTYIFAAVRDGAKYTKRGKRSLQPLVCATLQVMDVRVLLDRFVPEEPIPTDCEEPVYLDVRGVRNPATKSRNVRYRIAASPGWKSDFSLMWDKTIIARGEMEAILIDAGKLCGLADGRSIGSGRFTVNSFDVTDA